MVQIILLKPSNSYLPVLVLPMTEIYITKLIGRSTVRIDIQGVYKKLYNITIS